MSDIDDDLPPEGVDLDAPFEPEGPLAKLTLEAKASFTPSGLGTRDIDWAAQEERLAMRLELERAREARSRKKQLAIGAGMSLTLAAGMLFLLSAPPETRAPSTPTREVASIVKGGLRGATPRAAGSDPSVLNEGDTLDVADGPLVYERQAAKAGEPRRAIWALDPAGETSARAKVVKASSTLVVALERGALEADVTPVRDGEAFAVDVSAESGTTRVAVHGTHLRVARRGDQLVVDLTEGVIALGQPSEGRTEGMEIKAPAHVEMTIGKSPASARIAHENVRPAWSLDSVAEGHAPPPPPALQPTAPAGSGSAQAQLVPQRHPEAALLWPSAPSSGSVQTAEPVASAPAAPAVALSEGAARTAIQVDLKRCAVQGNPGQGVAVSIESTLTIDVRADGSVSGTRFDPPLAPAIQECTSKAVFARRIEGPRSFTVPVKFQL
jgi:hypothetical protein